MHNNFKKNSFIKYFFVWLAMYQILKSNTTLLYFKNDKVLFYISKEGLE